MSTHRVVKVELWAEDAIVLYDWLARADLDKIPTDHKAVKQALTDLFGRLDEIIPYEFDLTAARIADARDQVSKDMGW
ncbi:hypothetical protein EYE40_01600 [Glaciihabitans arcticus]|uniref:Uncharacterized protein n=1 Tax=Glaciihabitans arcticus TaxID=2668039 RepID=A0A4Q9GN20_9MICO|nr:hypothetical protein [Glaciihabitans arcticus]TBN56192.1 hypothetical protein EYE40_01600 [Glaciihabitans arcticus]